MSNFTSPLKILSFNIRVAICERGTSHYWPLRRDFCRDVIAQGGYDFIFDRAAAPYSRKSFDVTDDLLKEMGVEPHNARGRDEGK